MPMTEGDIRGFADFARRKLANGGVESREECLALWQAQQEGVETLASIRRGLDQANAGNTRPFADLDAELQSKYGCCVDP